MKLQHNELLALLRLIDLTRTREINCDEFLSRAAGYLERAARGCLDPDQYQDFLHHLKLCPECEEEFEALADALRQED